MCVPDSALFCCQRRKKRCHPLVSSVEFLCMSVCVGAMAGV